MRFLLAFTILVNSMPVVVPAYARARIAPLSETGVVKVAVARTTLSVGGSQ